MNPYLDPLPNLRTPVATDNGLGWTAVGLAVAICVPCLPLAGVVIAVVALARNRFRPRWLAVLALLIGVAGTAAQVAVLANADFQDGVHDALDESQDDDSRKPGDPLEVLTAKLRRGDCFDDPNLRHLDADGTTTLTVTVLPCREKHDYEAYALFPVPGKSFPGQAGVDKVVRRCFPAFRQFVGQSYGESVYEIYYYGPTKQSWRMIGDKTVTCVAGHPKRQVRGTLEGAQR